MKTKVKRILAAILCMCVIIAFAGCSEKNATNDDGTVKIVWYVGGTSQPDRQKVYDALNAKLKEKLGVELELSVFDFGSYDEKMNMVISSGENYDLCFTSSWTNKFLQNASGGAYLALDEYLNGDFKALKDSLPEYIWAASTVNGKIYAVPNYQITAAQSCFMTPKRLADKYGFDLDFIHDVKELEPYLKKLKENEKSIYPFNPLSMFEVDYEKIPNVPALAISSGGENAGKLFKTYETPEYKERINTMRDFYEKGYIRSDMLSAEANSTTEISNLRYGVWMGTMKPGGDAENMKQYGEEILCIPISEPYNGMNAGQTALTAVSAKSKNPEMALKVLELMNTDKEIYNMLCFGLEGVHYEKVGENRIKNIPDSGYDMNAAWVFGNQFNAYYTEGQEDGIWEETDEMNRVARQSPLAGISIDISNIKSEIAKLAAVESEYSFLNLGVEDPKMEYENFIAKLKTAGVDKVYDEINRQIQEFLAKKQ